MSHTPGPWTARTATDEPHVVAIYHDEQGRRCTAFVAVCSSTTLANAENAILIAAAPELLAALKALAAHMDRAGGDGHGMPECPWCKAGSDGDDHSSDCELLAARAAIARAEGSAGRDDQP